MCVWRGGGGGGVDSSRVQLIDKHDRRILGGLKFSLPGFFGWENLANIFLGALI